MRGHIIYYGVTLFGGFALLLFFVNQLSLYKENAKHKIAEATLMTERVEYIEVKPVKETFLVGEPLKFTSKRIVKQIIPLYFNDILFCDYGDNLGSQRVSSRESNNPSPKTGNRTTARREYLAQIPRTPATCYLQSTITIHPYDTTKMQTLESSLFYVK